MKRLSVGPKDKPRSGEYSAFLRMEREFTRSKKTFGSGTIEQMYPPLVCWIKNTTSSNVGAFGVLGLDAPLIAPTSSATSVATIANRSTIAFKGVAPLTATPHYGKYAILQEPSKALGKNGLVRGVIGGVTWCKLNINDADDVAAEITNNQTAYLNTQPHGSARILWKESGTGTDKWGLVHLGVWPAIMLGKTDAAIAKGASGTVSVWSGVEGSEADTGVNVTAYNRFANVAITKWVLVVSIQGRLYLAAAEC
jgi:hypothetical protein